LLDDYDFALELERQGYAAHRLIRILGLKERTYYNRKKREKTEPAPKKKPRGRPPKETSEIIGVYSENGKEAIITDEQLIEILKAIYANENRDDPYYYVKTMGSKKLSIYLRREKGILVNHKKLDRLRKSQGWMRKYTSRNHLYNSSKEHLVQSPDRLWQVDIKMYHTQTHGLLQVLTFLDVYDKWVCGMYIGKHCTYHDVKRTLKEAIRFRGIEPSQLMIRSDNGAQFKAKNLLKYEKELSIEHEFGIKHNPNSQAYVESFHSSCQREFETHVLAFDKADLKNKLNAYIHYYHCLRPHGSLKYQTPFDFRRAFFENPSISKEIKVYV